MVETWGYSVHMYVCMDRCRYIASQVKEYRCMLPHLVSGFFFNLFCSNLNLTMGFLLYIALHPEHT